MAVAHSHCYKLLCIHMQVGCLTCDTTALLVCAPLLHLSACTYQLPGCSKLFNVASSTSHAANGNESKRWWPTGSAKALMSLPTRLASAQLKYFESVCNVNLDTDQNLCEPFLSAQTVFIQWKNYCPSRKSSLAIDTLHAYILVKIVATETIMVTPSNSILLHCAGVEQTV